MGKFYDAMQRATESVDEYSSAPKATSLPELDQSLLEPEDPHQEEPFPEAIKGKHSTDPAIYPEKILKIKAVEHSDVQSASAPTVSQQNTHDSPPSVDASRFKPKAEVEPIFKPALAARSLDTGVYVSPVHTAYERIIQRLQEFRRSPDQSVIHFSSAVPGEGTSTVARNTAVLLARHESDQVLLIDANLRTPSQHQVFGVDREPGFSDAMMGNTKVASVIKDNVAPKLALITAGSMAPSPAQLLSVQAIQSALVSLRSLYDWIIIDSPPVLSFPDSMSVAGASAGAVVVVRAEKTRAEVVEEALRNLESTGVDVLGAVLNGRRYHIPEAIYRKL